MQTCSHYGRDRQLWHLEQSVALVESALMNQGQPLAALALVRRHLQQGDIVRAKTIVEYELRRTQALLAELDRWAT